MPNSVFIQRVTLRHFKSIAACEVELRPLSIIVGPNGSGKSNFVESLEFVRDALRESLDSAVRKRGGINEVRRRSGGHPTNMGIRLDFTLGNTTGFYAFELHALSQAGYEVKREQCSIIASASVHEFNVEAGVVTHVSTPTAPAASKERLYLVNASGLKEFRPLYEALSSMGFYNLHAKAMRDLQDPDDGRLLRKDGGNLASVIARLESASAHDPTDVRKQRIADYLHKVASSVRDVKFRAVGPKHSLEFFQEVEGQKAPWRFWAASMSDGTMRALGVLTAVFQHDTEVSVPLVAIEEPETALHPAAADVLLGSLLEAAENQQVLVTSHSAEILERDHDLSDCLIAVENIRGVTHIGPVSEEIKQLMRDHTFTPGELLRQGQLMPVLFSNTPQRELFS